LHTSSGRDGRSFVAARASPLVGGRDGLEVVGVDDQRTPTNAAAEEVMAGVADDQAQIVLSRKVDTSLDVCGSPGGEDKNRIVSERAAVAGIGGGTASVVGEVSPETSGRQINPEARG